MPALGIAVDSPQLLRLSAEARTCNGKPDPFRVTPKILFIGWSCFINIKHLN